MNTTTPQHNQLFLYPLHATTASKKTTPRNFSIHPSQQQTINLTATNQKFLKPRMGGTSLKLVFITNYFTDKTFSKKYFLPTNNDP